MPPPGKPDAPLGGNPPERASLSSHPAGCAVRRRHRPHQLAAVRADLIYRAQCGRADLRALVYGWRIQFLRPRRRSFIAETVVDQAWFTSDMTTSEPEVPESPATWENVVVGDVKEAVGHVLRDKNLAEEGDEQKEIAHEVREEYREEHEG